MTDLKPIRSEEDYEEALAGVERLWGAPLARRMAIGSIFLRR